MKKLAPILLVLISLAISLLLAEGLVRLAGAAGLVDLTPTLNDVASPAGEPADPLRDLEDVDDAVGEDGARSLYVSDPFLHHRMAPNWSGFFPEEMMQQVGRSQIPIRTNSLGLRNEEVALPKPLGVFRILVLGDSVTFGWGVREDETYANQLADLLATSRPGQRFEVINAGVSGYGTWQELLWLQSMGLQLAPDLVVVQIHLNDATDNLWGAWIPQAGQELLPAGNVQGNRSGWPAGWLAQHSQLYRLVQRLNQTRQIAGTGGSGTCEDDWHEGTEQVCWDSTILLLERIQQVAAEHDLPVVLLLAPMQWQVEPGVQDPRAWVDTQRYQGVFKDFAAQQNLLLVDPLPAMRRASSGKDAPSFFLNVGHPNKAGHRVLAQELYGVLTQNGLLP